MTHHASWLQPLLTCMDSAVCSQDALPTMRRGQGTTNAADTGVDNTSTSGDESLK